jgi:hypothetical protein
MAVHLRHLLPAELPDEKIVVVADMCRPLSHSTAFTFYVADGATDDERNAVLAAAIAFATQRGYGAVYILAA